MTSARSAPPASAFEIRPLAPATWDAFAALVERNGGVWGGCWCLEFHPEGKERSARRREMKACRVREGTAHAALVFHDGTCVGWCQYGSPEELPRIKRKREYERVVTAPALWRITCFFVDKAWRGKGVAHAALRGALEQIAGHGGGRVESFPEDVGGRSTSSSFLHNGSVAMFEREGFARERQLGKHHWLVARDVGPTRAGSY